MQIWSMSDLPKPNPICINVKKDMEEQLTAELQRVAPVGFIWDAAARTTAYNVILSNIQQTCNKLQTHTGVSQADVKVDVKLDSGGQEHISFIVRLTWPGV